MRGLSDLEVQAISGGEHVAGQIVAFAIFMLIFSGYMYVQLTSGD